MSCWPRRLSSVAASVENPVFVRRVGFSPSLSYRIVRSCGGELRLKGPPPST